MEQKNLFDNTSLSRILEKNYRSSVEHAQHVKLQKYVVRWYHEVLCHPGMNRTVESTRQHFIFKNLREEMQKQCGTCKTCQLTKRDTKIWVFT